MTSQSAKTSKPRESSRRSMFLSATLTFEGIAAPVAVRVRNLSAGGMMVEANIVADAGHPVVSDIKGLGPVEGKVAWSDQGRMGISFTVEIDPEAARFTAGKPKFETAMPLVIPTGRRPGLAIR